MVKKTTKKAANAETISPTITPEQASETNPSGVENTKIETKKEPVSLNDILMKFISSLKDDPEEGAAKHRDNLIKAYLNEGINKYSISSKYNILFLYDKSTMIKSDADHIYSAAAAFKEKKPILLILYSTGGQISSAYLIGKLCQEYAKDEFVIVVPRQAKSAATLLCCAADQIHMGSFSELGPIDPQINEMPALGLKSSIEHIAGLVDAHPQSSDMFAKYLSLSIRPIDLGYFERVAESAAQYAERLLKNHQDKLSQPPSKIAAHLVYFYKDHGFVVDKTEAKEIFGDNIIKTNTEEYNLGNDIYERFQMLSYFANIMNHSFYFIGSVDSSPHFQKQNK